jgi:hypothetical protein
VERVKTLAERVLHKVRLRDRAQAVVLAYESGLVQPATDVVNGDQEMWKSCCSSRP